MTWASSTRSQAANILIDPEDNAHHGFPHRPICIRRTFATIACRTIEYMAPNRHERTSRSARGITHSAWCCPTCY